MNFKKYSDDFEEGVIDYESGELNDPDAEQKEKDKQFAKRAKELIEWLINHQGRQRHRVSFTSQKKALKRLVSMKVTGDHAKRIIIEKEAEDYWRNKEEMPDFWTVVSTISKRK